MAPALPLTLTPADLSPAELSALVLDGELARLGDGYRPVDVPAALEVRGHTLRSRIAPGLVAERRTAAWLHGALTRPPDRLQLSMRSDARIRAPEHTGVVVRERRLLRDEWQRAGPVATTTALRTALDLALTEPEFDHGVIACVATLLLAADVTPEQAARTLARTGPVRDKRRALDRLHGLTALPGLSAWAS